MRCVEAQSEVFSSVSQRNESFAVVRWIHDHCQNELNSQAAHEK